MGPEPTQRTWTIYVCPCGSGMIAEQEFSCGNHPTPEEWDRYGSGAYQPEQERIEVVPASVLEERDRTIRRLTDDLNERRRQPLYAVEELESLRSQLTEARALLNRYDAEVVAIKQDAEFDGSLADHVEAMAGNTLAKLLRELLVPAPQDREPA